MEVRDPSTPNEVFSKYWTSFAGVGGGSRGSKEKFPILGFLGFLGYGVINGRG